MPVRRNSRGCRYHQEFATSSASLAESTETDKFLQIPEREWDAMQELHGGFTLRWTISSDSIQTRYRNYMELPKNWAEKGRHSTRNALKKLNHLETTTHSQSCLLSLPSSVWLYNKSPTAKTLENACLTLCNDLSSTTQGKTKKLCKDLSSSKVSTKGGACWSMACHCTVNDQGSLITSIKSSPINTAEFMQGYKPTGVLAYLVFRCSLNESEALEKGTLATASCRMLQLASITLLLQLASPCILCLTCILTVVLMSQVTR